MPDAAVLGSIIAPLARVRTPIESTPTTFTAAPESVSLNRIALLEYPPLGYTQIGIAAFLLAGAPVMCMVCLLLNPPSAANNGVAPGDATFTPGDCKLGGTEAAGPLSTCQSL